MAFFALLSAAPAHADDSVNIDNNGNNNNNVFNITIVKQEYRQGPQDPPRRRVRDDDDSMPAAPVDAPLYPALVVPVAPWYPPVVMRPHGPFVIVGRPYGGGFPGGPRA